MKIETKADEAAPGCWALLVNGHPVIRGESHTVVSNVADMLRTRRPDLSECGELAAGILARVPVVTWRHRDGREVRIYRTYKVRQFPDRRIDQWPVLHRADVASLTDEQWEAAPVEEGWTRGE